MASDQSNNVIQFPGRKKDAESAPVPAKANPSKPAHKSRKGRVSKKNLAGTLVAIVLATAAVNRYVFETTVQSFSFTSYGADASDANVHRGIASLEAMSWSRDAQWEKQLAEKLASPAVRTLASTRIGRPASTEDKLRWGILEEKYTIAYNVDDHRIYSILLQDESTAPSYILDRDQFLREYGSLFALEFSAAKLKSVESSNGKTIESYTLYKRDNSPAREARFELDRHKRLISLKVEPTEI